MSSSTLPARSLTPLRRWRVDVSSRESTTSIWLARLPNSKRSTQCTTRRSTAGVTLMPGVGFGVVPTDCLALHLKRRMPEGVSIDIGFATTGGVSGGTLRTLAAGFGDRGGVPGDLLRTRQIDFDTGSKRCIENPWRGDRFTAPLSTGIDAVTTWISLPRPLARVAGRSSPPRRPRPPPLPARVLRRIAARAPAGPSAKKRACGHAEVWAQITDPSGALSRRLVDDTGRVRAFRRCGARVGSPPRGRVADSRIPHSSARSSGPTSSPNSPVSSGPTDDRIVELPPRTVTARVTIGFSTPHSPSS